MILTNWGYEILSEELPSIITLEEFNAMTLGKYSNDQRAQYALSAITASIRNYCGWHVSGNVECSVTYSFDDLHIARTFNEIIIQLPSRCATSITKIMTNGEEINPDYFLKQNGILKIYGGCGFFKTITINFMSGLLSDDGLKSVVCSRVSNALSGPVGINSESAGGVSVSYSNSYVAGSNASTLLTSDKEYLIPYKIDELL